MFNKLSNKELVTVTHDLAKTLSADAQFLDVAKLLAESATRLDVTLTRANELLRKAEEAEALMLAMRDDSLESRSKLELITAEFAAMKSGPQGFFTYDSGGSYEEHDTAEAAIEYAEGCIDDYRGDACDGWSDETGSVVWGVIMQRATMIDERPRTEEDSHLGSHISTICDFALLPNIDAHATDAMVNEIRAEGVELFASAIQGGCAVGDRVKDLADEFANQLRADAVKDGE